MTSGSPGTASAPALYIVTDRHATGGRDLVDVVAAALQPLRTDAFAWAAPRVAVQLRERDLPGRALLDLSVRLRQVTAAAGVRLFVNGRPDVAVATGADGVHLGWRSPEVAEVRALFPDLLIGLSTHSAVEIERAHAGGLAGRPDFVVFGPIYETPSKRGIMNAKGLHELTLVTPLGIPVVAIGGLGASSYEDLFRSGACGMACIRSVMQQTDPAAAVRGLLVNASKHL